MENCDEQSGVSAAMTKPHSSSDSNPDNFNPYEDDFESPNRATSGRWVPDVNCDCDGHGSGYATDPTTKLSDQLAPPAMASEASRYEEFRYGRERSDSSKAEAEESMTRRRFIQGVAVSGTLGYGAFRAKQRFSEDRQLTSDLASQRAESSPSTAGSAPEDVIITLDNSVAGPSAEAVAAEELIAAPVGQRVLVVIELAGGNDGLSTIVPYASGTYRDRRPRLAVEAETVIPIDDEVGLAPGLAGLNGLQFATVEGVGPVEGVLSHFEMVERWERGDVTGTTGERSGFLGRLTDQLDKGGAVTGLSVAGHTPRFHDATSSTLSLNNPNHIRVLTNDDWIFPYYRKAVRGFGGGPMATTITQSWSKLFDVGDAMDGNIEKVDNELPMIKEGRDLGRQLFMAAELIKADVGVKVIHAQLTGFDTHDGHGYRHNSLMERLGASIKGFNQMLVLAGIADRVLIATTSEFGRRVSENGNGFDHGAASSMLLVGPVKTGRLGDPSPLGDLDSNGNLRTTIGFDRYLGTLAQGWLGVDAGSVLPGSPTSIDLF